MSTPQAPATPSAASADPEAARLSEPAAAPPPAAGAPWAGYALAAAGAILFSAKGVIIKFAYAEGVDTETLLALRMGLSVPVYVAIGFMAVAREGRPAALDARMFVAVLGVGLLGYWFASYTDFLGLNYISAPFERLILFTYPLFTVLLGAAFFGQPFRLEALGAFALSYAGLALVFTKDMTVSGAEATQIGAALVLCSAVAFALYQLLAKPRIGALGPKLFTCIAMTGAAIGAIVQFLILRDLSVLWELTTRAWVVAFVLAFVGTLLPTFLLSAALHKITAQANAVIGTVSPIATLALAAVLLAEPVTLIDFAGAALVLAGVGWFTLAERK
ncbi:DMT family transporter [Chenggangzhangella methanolivorans]|uniref:DMT family transporter n=1 Tax=Chenggangzhangella methanolivorans TaxID=1437009 RepID=A0A9E6RCQ8_9HYPH|nr:DMT family transporter [Chenggangzhangella methanolivorans]QZO01930.1 DMT family transporter [Chenggangzhangella methanolivorans]